MFLILMGSYVYGCGVGSCVVSTFLLSGNVPEDGDGRLLTTAHSHEDMQKKKKIGKVDLKAPLQHLAICFEHVFSEPRQILRPNAEHF